MKHRPRKEWLTLGGFIMSMYDLCDEHQAREIVWLAIRSRFVICPGELRCL